MTNVSSRKRKAIFDITNGLCFYCGCKLDFDNFHMDHFKPKSNGGRVSENLVPACPDCNLFKGNLDIEEFRTKIGGLLNRHIDGRMISKYFEVDNKPIRFYFEEFNNGILPKNINEFLDRRKDC